VRKLFFAPFIALGLMLSAAQPLDNSVKIGLLKYKGGGDWYANPTSLGNLIKFCNEQLGTNIDPDPLTVEPDSPELFNLAFVHATGHGNITFNDSEASNLRKWLEAGGFLHLDDNYGMDPFVRPALKKVFPELELQELPFSYPIYTKERYIFSSGLPKIHEHEGKAAEGYGLIYQGRLVVFYSHECDLGDGWENPEVHKDSPQARENALKMGANLLQYAFTN
jgi:hypothetical protein